MIRASVGRRSVLQASLICGILAACTTNGGMVPGPAPSPSPTASPNYNVLYSFKGGNDGAEPWGRPTLDAAGALYGMTSEGGIYSCAFLSRTIGCGTIFKLTPSGDGYTERVLYRFCQKSCARSGASPDADLTLTANGTLYGTATLGGKAKSACLSPFTYGCGTAFSIGAMGNDYDVLFRFNGRKGASPDSGLVPDKYGALYGTANNGGAHRWGAVYKLAPSRSGYTESVLYSFNGTKSGPDGAFPVGGVIFGNGGTLYGVTAYGGLYGAGTVYKLTPAKSGYTEDIIYTFCAPPCPQSAFPQAGLVMDDNGALYGTAYNGGAHGVGDVFKLTPSGSRYTWSDLYSFCSARHCRDGAYPYAGVTLGRNGTLYGTTLEGGARRKGTIFELTRSGSRYTERVLHSLDGSQGLLPYSGVVLGPDGALYGMTYSGGAHGDGAVFRLRP